MSSVKELAVKALREAASLGVQPLSIHPMFGPTAESLKGETIAVIPVIEGDAETDLAASLFDEAEIVAVEQEEHDRLMAIVLSLTYFMNLAFTRVLSEADIISVKRLAGTTFTVQLAVAESIVSEDPGLVASLLRENRHNKAYLEGFIAEADRVRGLIEGRSKAFGDLFDSLRASLGRDPDYHEAEERRHRAFEALRA
ncbi:MAG: prephenate dehydrogenase/arogenate dehydrogenase family protein [Candidatus Bathyarchaeota archaeon]|nr:prephenate dehydrogenase/arogenate dehydrogenase family protein [Candidatus Bathyarchaeota archaeon]